ncbi:MAG TPA: type II toxin-antitoxin system VapC family toxin [Candidatus Binatia bacterium]|nr:type II toxin-antitoxin system VapC family toxin [Candidatus Binatia bacterium]
MKRLLDTHAFLWADGEPERLSAAAKAACEDQDSELLLSVVSVWEIQIKIQLGKLALRSGLREIMGAWVQRNNLRILPVNLEHVLRLEVLPSHHKDPFDRLLVAQAQAEGCELISHDRLLRQYPVTVVW